jgi:hypothetical protein
MQMQDVQQRLQQSPFKPFRMHLTDGSSYEVRHPELILLGRRSLILGIPIRPEGRIIETAVHIDFMHIVRMDYLDGERRRASRRRNGD